MSAAVLPFYKIKQTTLESRKLVALIFVSKKTNTIIKNSLKDFRFFKILLKFYCIIRSNKASKLGSMQALHYCVTLKPE